jgi:hypothetical protein
MKLIKTVLIIFAVIAIVSCKTDDNTDDSSATDTTDANYFPITIGSNWTYTIDTDGQDPQEDALFVAGTQESDGNTYTDIESNDEPFGFVTGILESNLLRTVDSQLLVKGMIGAPIDGFPGIMIELEDFIMFDASVSSGQLDAITGLIEQNVEGIPLEFEYGFKTVGLPASSSLSVNGVVYNDVVNTSFVLTLAVTAQIEVGGFVIPFPILSQQDVLTGTASFAKETGFIMGESTVDYELEDLSGLGIELPVPSEATTLTLETITNFEIGN